MRFCFIVEEQYRHERMPMAVAEHLLRSGHDVTVLEPHATVTCLSDLATHEYDAVVLKTVSDGPGLSILDAAGAVGAPTVNDARAIRLVRDKAVAAAVARAHGIPIPITYFVAHPSLLEQVPDEHYPLVIKPSNGSSCRGIYRVDDPGELVALQMPESLHSYFLAQPYAENTGRDIKLYVIGSDVHAVAKRSPLHGEKDIAEGLISLVPELRQLALRVGKIFGLEIYGLDVVETPRGWAVLDINDFPSFGFVPHAVERIAAYLEAVATCATLPGVARSRASRRGGRSKRGVPSALPHAVGTGPGAG